MNNRKTLDHPRYIAISALCGLAVLVIAGTWISLSGIIEANSTPKVQTETVMQIVNHNQGIGTQPLLMQTGWNVEYDCFWQHKDNPHDWNEWKIVTITVMVKDGTHLRMIETHTFNCRKQSSYAFFVEKQRLPVAFGISFSQMWYRFLVTSTPLGSSEPSFHMAKKSI